MIDFASRSSVSSIVSDHRQPPTRRALTLIDQRNSAGEKFAEWSESRDLIILCLVSPGGAG